MGIAIGVFDLFAYAVPGSLYLGLFLYVADEVGWLDVPGLMHSNTTVLLVIGILASYLLGHVSYFLGRALGRLIPLWSQDFEDARREFVARTPVAGSRRFVMADRSILQAAIEVRNHDVVLEIIRLRAVGLMLRNTTPVFILAAVTALSSAIIAAAPGFSVALTMILMGAATGSFWQGRRLIHWSNIKTLEVAFWIDGIDDLLADRAN